MFATKLKLVDLANIALKEIWVILRVLLTDCDRYIRRSKVYPKGLDDFTRIWGLKPGLHYDSDSVTVLSTTSQ